MREKVIKIGPAIRLLVLLVGLSAAGFAAWACVDIEMMYAAVGMASLFIILSPFLQLEEYDLFSPWSFVILPVGLLSTPQAVCMSFSWPTEEAIERMMLLREGPEFFLFPAGILLLAFASLTLGYHGFRSKKVRNIYLGRDLSHGRTMFSLAVIGLIAVIATVAFVRVTGGAESGRLTDKRTNLKTLDVEGGDTQQHGHIRQVSKLTSVVFLIFYSYALTHYKRMPLSVALILMGGFLLSLALPFYASSRAQVAWVMINTIGVNYYLGRGNFFLKLGVFLCVGLGIFFFMSQMRNKEQDVGMQTASFEKSMESLLLNRNGPGLSKTAHIINAIPGKLDYKYGSTIAEWLLAPIPRVLYPTKPMMGTGTEIGTAIYGTKLSGIPPGLIAELYWNFHIAGVFFGMLSFGYFLEKLHGLFRDIRTNSAIVVPVYLFSVIPIAFGVLGNCLGYGIMMRLVDFVSISAVIWLCSKWHLEVPQNHTDGPPMVMGGQLPLS